MIWSLPVNPVIPLSRENLTSHVHWSPHPLCGWTNQGEAEVFVPPSATSVKHTPLLGAPNVCYCLPVFFFPDFTNWELDDVHFGVKTWTLNERQKRGCCVTCSHTFCRSHSTFDGSLCPHLTDKETSACPMLTCDSEWPRQGLQTLDPSFWFSVSLFSRYINCSCNLSQKLCVDLNNWMQRIGWFRFFSFLLPLH